MAKAKDIVISLILDGKQFDATIQNSDQLVKKIKSSVTGVSDAAAKWATITTGFNQALEISEKVFNQFKDSVKGAADLGVLRSNFKGTADDINLFRKATANTVSESNLIKLSNQATDLGINLKDQALLFSLADDAGDKYGMGVEEGFRKLVTATEGGTKGLKEVGIQKEKYEEIVNSLAKAEGDTIENLDAETQKRIKLEAIIKASGITMDDVKNKTQDQADKLSSLGIRIDEAKLKMGEWIADGLVPVIDMLGQTTSGTAGFSDAVVAATTSIPALIGMLGSLKMAGANLGWIAKFIAAPIALGVGAGMGIDYLRENNVGPYHKPTGEADFKIKNMIGGNIQGTDQLVSGDPSKFIPTPGVFYVPGDKVYDTRTTPPPPPPPPPPPNKNGKGGGKTKIKIDEFDPFAFDKGEMEDQRDLMYELDAEKEKLYLTEKERIIDLNNTRDEYFASEKEQRDLDLYERQTALETMNQLEWDLLTEEQNRKLIEDQMRIAKTDSELKALLNEKKITDEKIKIIKAEKDTRIKSAMAMMEAGAQQYDSTQNLGKQLNQLANESIRRIIAEAVATQIAKVIASVPFPFNAILAPLAGMAVQAMIEKAIPKFATGVTNFSGGTAMVGELGPEIIELPRGSNVIPHAQSMEIIKDNNYSMDGFRMVANEIRNQTERLEALERIVKLDANSFDEAYSDFNNKKAYVG